MKEAPTNWSLVAWEYCIEKLNYDADVVFFGDSIVSESNFQKAFPAQAIIEFGLPGDSLIGMIQRTEMIKNVKPEKVFIMGGINSIRNGNDVTLSQYRELLQTIQTENIGAEVYVMSILPISADKEKTVTTNKNIELFNQKLQEIATQMNIIYVDLFSLYEKDGYMNPKFTRDGVHLTEEAYEIWEEAVREHID